jgi:hypothetical protein
MIEAWKLFGDHNERRDDGLGEGLDRVRPDGADCGVQVHRSHVARINQAADSNTTP